MTSPHIWRSPPAGGAARRCQPTRHWGGGGEGGRRRTVLSNACSARPVRLSKARTPVMALSASYQGQ